MTSKVIAAIEFLGLVYYEVMLALITGAFQKMKSQKKLWYLVLAVLPLALMTMFRAGSIGNDTQGYIDYFDSIKSLSLSQALDNTRFEKGYILLNYILSRISKNSQILLIVSGAFSYFSLSRWIYKWSAAPGLILCLAVEMLYIDSWMNIVRQAIAFFILLFAFDDLVERKFWRFLVITVLAAQFHNAAYAFLLAWPVAHLLRPIKRNSIAAEKRFQKLILVSGIVAFFFISPLLNQLINLFPVYSYYAAGEYMNGEARLAVILKIVVYSLMIYIPGFLGKKKAENMQTSQIAIHRFAVLNIAIMLLANRATVFMRVTNIFSFYALPDYIESVNGIEYRANRKILIVFTLIAFAVYGLVITLLKTPEWQTTYPFEWCFA